MPLSVYWDNHLRVAFEESAPQLYRPMLHASLAHVVMLAEQGLLPADRAGRLLGGLRTLLSAEDDELAFDGSVEDVYYLTEQRLAKAAGIKQSELDVQLARSRNDLDAGVFRMVLRDAVLEQAAQACAAAEIAAEQADRYADVLITGLTHRRPAQPTSLGHVLAGYGEALVSQVREMLSVYDELNVNPLGSCAFAGTDLPISVDRLTTLLGFRTSFTSSYEAVAGAEHLVRAATVQARVLATGARMARTMLDWMTWQWIVTPEAYCQGSSIMPQKKNPVVLEHMCSMAGAAAADLAATLNNVGVAWYEDSNNATTDVQKHLWRANDRALRFLTLMRGLLSEITPLTPPAPEDVVSTGATTTAIAEALAGAGIPWRGAHSVVGALVREAPPAQWTEDLVAKAIEEAGLGDADGTAVRAALDAGLRPERVLDRPQVGGPGRDAVRRTAAGVAEAARSLSNEFAERRLALQQAEDALRAAVDGRLAGTDQ